MAEEKKLRPVKVIRYGGVKASIWENQSDKGVWYSVSIGRNYKDAKDVWQETNTFRQNDLPKLEKTAAEAFTWIVQEAGKEE